MQAQAKPGYLSLLSVASLLLLASALQAHDLSGENAEFVKNLAGPAPGPFLYLGAKHMITGFDHLLFLLGVVFFLYRGRDVILYVTLFTLGHSLTLLLGVVLGWQVNPYLIDTVIGLSVVYKAFENMGGFREAMGITLDTRWIVFAFGLCHGLGLAARLQSYINPGEGLYTNLFSFNVGVELGQIAALIIILLLLQQWRARRGFQHQAFYANAALMLAGFVLAGTQFAGYMGV